MSSNVCVCVFTFHYYYFRTTAAAETAVLTVSAFTWTLTAKIILFEIAFQQFCGAFTFTFPRFQKYTSIRIADIVFGYGGFGLMI